MIFPTFLLLLATIAYSETATIRSAADIKRYEEFLRNSVKGQPLAPLSPESEEKQSAWERSGKFEGDIILSEKQIEKLVDVYSGKKNGLLKQEMLWPDAELVYEIDTEAFDDEQVKAIEDAMEYISGVSCITFREKTEKDENYVDVQEGTGCSSQVGYINDGAQGLNLKPNDPGSGCFRKFTIVHEFLHALGFYHMQSTYNRDEYVKIVWSNIQANHTFNFNKYTSDEVTLLGTEYDYGSVLHYSSNSFAIDPNEDTIVALKPMGDLVMGQRDKMSDSDIVRLNKLYNCEDKKTKSKKPRM